MSLAEVPSNGDLPSNYGRTSPPAKTVLACEPINLCLWRRYLVMAIYPLNMAGLVALPNWFSHVNQSTYVFDRGYLVMEIYPLTMAGLVPLPKQFSRNIFFL